MPLAELFQRLLDLPDRAVTDVIAIVMGETLFAGSAAVEAVGLHIGVDMAAWWNADDAFFDGLRDKEVLTALVAEVGGDDIAAANAKEKGATLKTIVRDHLNGKNGRTQVEGWVPRWMAFPPTAYTERGGIGADMIGPVEVRSGKGYLHHLLPCIRAARSAPTACGNSLSTGRLSCGMYCTNRPERSFSRVWA